MQELEDRAVRSKNGGQLKEWGSCRDACLMAVVAATGGCVNGRLSGWKWIQVRRYFPHLTTLTHLVYQSL